MKQIGRHFKIAAMILASSQFIACAHYHDVRPMGSGENSVRFYTEYKGQGYHEAISQAHYYCSRHFGSRPVVLSERSRYIGHIPEYEYIQSKKTAGVIETIGVAGMLFGNENVRSVGTVLAITGDIAHHAMGPGYLFTMRFRCR